MNRFQTALQTIHTITVRFRLTLCPNPKIIPHPKKDKLASPRVKLLWLPVQKSKPARQGNAVRLFLSGYKDKK